MAVPRPQGAGKVKKRKPARGPQGLPTVSKPTPSSGGVIQTVASQPAVKKTVRKTRKKATGPQGLPIQNTSKQTRKPVASKPNAAERERLIERTARQVRAGKRPSLTKVQAAEVLRRGRENRGVVSEAIRDAINEGFESYKGVKSPLEAVGGKAQGKRGKLTYVTATATNPDAKEAGRRILNDAIDLPANTVASTYYLAKTLKEKGPVAAGEEIVKGTVDTLKNWKEHPLYAGLTVAGGYGAAGRGTGRVLRVSTKGRLGSTGGRAGKVVKGTKRIVPGSDRYSKNVFTKQAEKRWDKRGSGERVASPKDVRRMVDEDVQAAKIITQKNQGEAATRARDAVAPKKGRGPRRRVKPNAATNLASQGVVRTTRADLVKYLEEVRAQLPAVAKNERARKANLETQRLIERALKDFDPDEVAVAVRRYSELRRSQDAELVRVGLLDDVEAEAARFAGPAARRHNASGEGKREALKAGKVVKKERAGAVKDARKAVKRADTVLAKARADARVSVASRKKSPELVAAVRSRDLAVRQLASLKTRVAAGKVKDGPGAVRAARARVRDADARVRAETARLKGVAPRQADALRTALYDRDAALQARSRASKAEVAARQERKTVRKAAYVDDQGRPITVEQARQGLDVDPAFVSQQPFRVRQAALPEDRPSLPSGERRSGDAVRQGTLDVHPAKLVEQAVDTQRLIDTVKSRERFLDDWGYRAKPDGDVEPFDTQKLANQKAELLAKDTGQSWRAVTRQDGKSVLVPSDALARLSRHEAGVDVSPVAAGLSAQWRRNVLAFSPRWLVGNQMEGALRMMLEGAGPRSYITARKVLRKMDPDDAAQLRARTVGGGNYATADRIASARLISRDAAELGKFATAVYKFGQAPGPRHLVDLYGTYTNFVFRSLNGRLENQFQTAMLGKALRENPLMDKHTVKLSQKAIEEIASGIKNTDTFAQLGRRVDDMYGRYGKFSPGLQNAIANYTPFAAWAMNATWFVYVNLPKNHPVATALMASSNQASAEWRKSKGLIASLVQEDWQKPRFLQNSIPGKKDSSLRLGRYLPFGLLNEDGVPLIGAYTSLLLPQLQEIIKNANGQDWMGYDLSEKPDDARNALAAAASFLEGQVPLASQITNVAGVRLPSQRDSDDTDPGVGMRARKQFDPFMYTQSSKKKTVRKKDTGFDFSGGSSEDEFDFSGGASEEEFDFSGGN